MRVAIIGAGPAGMAAAITLIKNNVRVTLFDENSGVGGQIYRNLKNQSDRNVRVFGSDYFKGRYLLNQIEAASKTPLLILKYRATIWSVTAQKQVSWSVGGSSFSQQFDAIILATGAIERAMPVEGWTNPGVMSAGAAQILMKTAAYAPANSVLIGSGPLLYVVACQMIEMGKPPIALLETQTRQDLTAAIRQLCFSAPMLTYLMKGIGMLCTLKFAGIKRIKAITNVRIRSQNKHHIIQFNKGNTEHHIEAETVLLHAGVHPNIQLTQALGLMHHWSNENLSLEPVTDDFGRTTVKDILLAGDGMKILGADAAKQSGELAALALLMDTGFAIAPFDLSKRHAQQKKYFRVRKLLELLFPPKNWHSYPSDTTIICRCEEVTAGEVRHAIKMGCAGPNQLKAYSRCGMGNCQGRFCGLTVVNLISDMIGSPAGEVGYFRIRTPIKPITLEEMANHETISD